MAQIDECVYYNICKDGYFKAFKCPRKNLQDNLMFDPVAKECVEKRKLSVSGKCNSFKECVLINTVSSTERWTIRKCASLLQFDPINQECVDPNLSKCGNYSWI